MKQFPMVTVRGDAAQAEVSGGKVVPARTIHKCYFGLIPFLFMTSWLTYLDRGSVAFGALQFKKQLHLSNADYGLGSALFYVGYAVFQMPSNFMVHRIGAPIWLSFLVFSWGLVSTASAAMKSKAQFYVLRFFLGMAEAGCFPGAWYHMSLFFTSLELGYAYAATATATAFGQMLGAPIAAGLLMLDGRHGLHGWQWIYIIEGSITMAWAFALFSLLARGPAKAWFLRPAEQTWLSERQEMLHDKAQERDAKAGQWHAILRTWKIWYVACCYLLMQFSIASIVYFLPIIVEAMFSGNWNGTSKAQVFATPHDALMHQARTALISAILWIPVAVFMLVNAASSKHFKERNLHASIPLLIAGVCFMLVTPALQRSGPVAGYAVLIIAATAVESIHGPIWSWPKTFLHGQGAAIGIALFNSFGAIGGFAGPFVIGRLVSLPGGYATGMIVMGGINFFNAFFLFCFRPRDLEPEHVNEKEVIQAPLKPMGAA